MANVKPVGYVAGGTTYALYVPQRGSSRFMVNNVADRSRCMVWSRNREVFQLAVDGSKTGEELGHLGARVLLSSLVPVVFIASYSMIPSVAAAGFSESQRKAYDAFVQYGVQTPTTQGTPERGAGRARQQQDIEKSRIGMASVSYTHLRAHET